MSSLLKEFKDGVDACNVGAFLLAIFEEQNIAVDVLSAWDGCEYRTGEHWKIPQPARELWDTAEDAILDALPGDGRAGLPCVERGSLTAQRAIDLFNTIQKST